MSEQPVKSGKKLSATQIILIVGVLVIVAAIAFVGMLLLRQKQPEQTAAAPTAVPGGGSVVIDEYNVNDVIGELKRKAAEGMFEVKMNPTWHFDDGASPSADAYVANSEANIRPFYFEVTMDDGTVLYTSPMVPVGSAVKDITLLQDLDAGDYECVCTYNTVNEDESIEDSVSVVVRIQVAQ